MRRRMILVLGLCMATGACHDKQKHELAPAASTLKSAKLPPKSTKLVVESASSKIDFMMDAPFEKIYGEAPGAIEGSVNVDPRDVTKSRGLIRVDLLKLYLFQRKRPDEASDYGEKVRNPKQNQHMKEWFGIDDAVPAAEREKNRWAQFSLDKVDKASATDLTKLSGPSRKITATVAGELLLHGHRAPKSIKIEATFGYSGDTLTSLSVKSLTPLEIALKEHDIRPPAANTSEQVLQNWLGLFGKKVAEQAPVNLAFSARAQ